MVVDADDVAREVVAVGSEGLAVIRARFGDAVIASDGSLDRSALGEIVFADAKSRGDLEHITHPLIAARTRHLLESAAAGTIVVHDVPLLVEKRMGANYHLTVVVGAEEDIRLARLMGTRGLGEGDARSRMAAQASDSERRAAADVWLDNNGTVDRLLGQVDVLWQDRITGFSHNLMTGDRSVRPDAPTLAEYDDTWPLAAARLIERITLALGDRAMAVEHIGSTSVPGLAAKDVIDLQVSVQSLSDGDAPEFLKALADRGFPRMEGNDQDVVHPWSPDPASWAKRFHGSADPGRVVHLHVREHGSAGWESALLFRDWLVANPAERDAYADVKRVLARSAATLPEYSIAKEPWIARALERARAWARHTGWLAR